MIATWTNPDGAQDNRTCFVHLRDRGTIYQRREPDGRWYIFKNYLNKPDDEFRKLGGTPEEELGEVTNSKMR